MTTNSTENIPEGDLVLANEKKLQARLSEQKKLLQKLKSALINSANNNDIEFLVKRL